MLEKIEELKARALRELTDANLDTTLEEWRVRYLGRKSELTSILRGLAQLSIEDRKSIGAFSNKVKILLEERFNERKEELETAKLKKATSEESIDVSLPGRKKSLGRLHPITQTLYEICDVFTSMGFQVVEGPEVESVHYNFEALNIPEEHPARDDMATMWVDHHDEQGNRPYLLRTHNTCVTARAMERLKPPLRVISIGKVYRYEASDATHSPMFYQIDGVAVDKNITMADLKGTLYEFAHRLFGKDRKVRFRCDFFPFVEPGAEMSVECIKCHGSGCRLCGYTGWLEILGCGMTHPNVLRSAGIDPNEYQSFAFGMGIDRIPMLRYGIDDIRLFYGSDLRFLRQM